MYVMHVFSGAEEAEQNAGLALAAQASIVVCGYCEIYWM
jgi:hypothetical protein